MRYLNNYRLFCLVVLLIFQISNVQAQRYLKKGNVYFDQNLYNEAIKNYLLELADDKKDETYTATLKMLAEAYRLTNRLEEAEDTYEKLLKINRKDTVTILNYAQALKGLAKYEEAKKEFLRYSTVVPLSQKGIVYAASADSAQKWLDEIPAHEVREIKSINSTAPDFSPAFYEDGILFSSSREGSTLAKGLTFEGGVMESKVDLYYVKIDGSEKTGNVTSLSQFNSEEHEGPATLSKDGNTIYFTRTVKGKRDKKAPVDPKKEEIVLNTLQIFKSVKRNGSWTEPVNSLPFNSNKFSVGHPSLSADGKSLYFMSDMPGNAGGTDIYVSSLKDSVWGTPVRLGAEINTFGYEMFPYIHEDGTLYFASDGHPGMGKLDIFSTKFDSESGRWSTPVNLKPPVNSIWDDFGLILYADQQKGFLTSKRYDGTGDDDIYSFIKNIPSPITLNGNTLEIEDNSIFNGITYFLLNENNQKEEPVASVDGKFSIPLKTGRENYTIVARKDGFAYNKFNISIPKQANKESLTVKIKPESQPVTFEGYLRNNTQNLKDTTSMINLTRDKGTVRLMQGPNQLKVVNTDTTGRYRFDIPLDTAKEYTITISKRQGATSDISPVINTGANTTAANTTTPNKAVINYSGNLQSNKLPVKGAEVELWNQSKLIQKSTTDDKGNYSMKLNPNENYILKISKEDYFPIQKNISAGGKTNLNESIELEQVVSVTNIYKERVKEDMKINPDDRVVFKVQIGAFKKKVGPEYFKRNDNVTMLQMPDGLYRYFAGSFTEYKQAAAELQEVNKKGFTDAFIVAFKANRKVSVKDNK